MSYARVTDNGGSSSNVKSWIGSRGVSEETAMASADNAAKVMCAVDGAALSPKCRAGRATRVSSTPGVDIRSEVKRPSERRIAASWSPDSRQLVGLDLVARASQSVSRRRRHHSRGCSTQALTGPARSIRNRRGSPVCGWVADYPWGCRHDEAGDTLSVSKFRRSLARRPRAAGPEFERRHTRGIRQLGAGESSPGALLGAPGTPGRARPGPLPMPCRRPQSTESKIDARCRSAVAIHLTATEQSLLYVLVANADRVGGAASACRLT